MTPTKTTKKKGKLTVNGFTPAFEKKILKMSKEINDCVHVWKCRKCGCMTSKDIHALLDDITGKKKGKS